VNAIQSGVWALAAGRRRPVLILNIGECDDAALIAVRLQTAGSRSVLAQVGTPEILALTSAHFSSACGYRMNIGFDC